MNQKPKPIIYTGWAYSYTSTEFYKDELKSGKTNFIKPGQPLFTNSIDLCNYLSNTKQNWVLTAVRNLQNPEILPPNRASKFLFLIALIR